MSAPNPTMPSHDGAAIPPFSPSSHQASLPAQTESSGGGVSVGKLLWLAAGIGAAYFVLKSIPEARRYLRLERM